MSASGRSTTTARATLGAEHRGRTMSDPDDKLLRNLRQAAEPSPPPGWRPGVIYSGRTPSEMVTPPMQELDGPDQYEAAVKALGFPLPEGMGLELVEAQYVYHENFWTREDQGMDAVTKPSASWRYRFRVVPKREVLDLDLAEMFKEIRKRGGKHKSAAPADGGVLVVNLSDVQVGKTDQLGGTREMLERSDAALREVLDKIKVLRPAKVVLADGGDSTEGFNSAPNAARVNDLQEVEAHRVWRRLFWHWISTIADAVDDLEVLSVPSNHCRNRQGKMNLGPITDDWGLDALGVMSDMAAVNPERYGHVRFLVPNEFEEHVSLTLEGKKVTFIHGHQAGSPKKATEWVKKMGRHDVGLSDIIVMGHFHRLSWETFGDDQTLIIVSSLDPGSSWYTTTSGERSRSGVTSFIIDKRGVRDLTISG